VIARLGLVLVVFLAASPRAAAQLRTPTILGLVHTSGDNNPPLAGAEVMIGSRKTATDARGQFRIDSMPVGEYDITIRHIGYRPLHSKVVVSASEPTTPEYFMKFSPYLLPDVVVESRRVGIYGVVRDLADRPIAGASVEIIGFNGRLLITDSLGRFSLPDAHKGGYLIRAAGDGYVERRLTVEVESGKGRDVTVQLAPGERRPVGNREATALFDLRQSLATGVARSRMMGQDVARYGSISVCEVPRIRIVAGPYPRGVLNGEKEIPVGQLCTWRMDEVAMIQLIPGTTRYTRGGPVHEDGYVILWEKW
jgi:hypothetical protein